MVESNSKRELSFPNLDDDVFKEWKQQETSLVFSEKELRLIQNSIYERSEVYYRAIVEREAKDEDATMARVYLDEYNNSLKYWMEYGEGDCVSQIDAGMASVAVQEMIASLVADARLHLQEEGRKVLKDYRLLLSKLWGASS